MQITTTARRLYSNLRLYLINIRGHARKHKYRQLKTNTAQTKPGFGFNLAVNDRTTAIALPRHLSPGGGRGGHAPPAPPCYLPTFRTAPASPRAAVTAFETAITINVTGVTATGVTAATKL